MSLSFHIRHEVTPARTKEVFQAIALVEPYTHVVQAERQETRLRQLGLVNNRELTEDGRIVRALCGKTPALWGDILHYLHYSLWDAQSPFHNGFSWTYRQFADRIWAMGTTCLDDSLWDPLVASLIGDAEANLLFTGGGADVTREGTVSLSRFSLIGASHWIRAVSPSVMQDGLFTRRQFCPPELALLALGWVGRTMGGEPGIDFLLTPERRDAVCRLCLLEPSALDRVLDWTLPLYPAVVQPGTSAGVYGRFIRYLKWPELRDLSR